MESSSLAIDLIRRVRANPLQYLGEKSLVLLEAFHGGYCDGARHCLHVVPEVSIEGFREKLQERYGIRLGVGPEVAAYRALCESEACAFDLFVSDVELAVAGGNCARADRKAKREDGAGQPITLLGMIESIAEHTTRFLFTPSIHRLRAFLDGYALALREFGFESAIDIDLNDFGIWVCRRHGAVGTVRWEKLVSAFEIDEQRAFELAVKLIRTYREEKGIPAPKSIQVRLTS